MAGEGAQERAGDLAGRGLTGAGSTGRALWAGWVCEGPLTPRSRPWPHTPRGTLHMASLTGHLDQSPKETRAQRPGTPSAPAGLSPLGGPAGLCGDGGAGPTRAGRGVGGGEHRKVSGGSQISAFAAGRNEARWECGEGPGDSARGSLDPPSSRVTAPRQRKGRKFGEVSGYHLLTVAGGDRKVPETRGMTICHPRDTVPLPGGWGPSQQREAPLTLPPGLSRQPHVLPAFLASSGNSRAANGGGGTQTGPPPSPSPRVGSAG